MNFLFRSIPVLLLIASVRAGDTAAVDPDLPQPIDFSFAETLVTNSPFTRVVSLEDSFQLTGIAYVDGHPMATVFDKRTKQSFLVSEEPNARGWSLVSAHAAPELDHTQVELRVGSETVAMHYQGQTLSPAIASTGSKSRSEPSGKKSGDTKLRVTSLLGEQGKAMYSSLSSDARDKFRNLMEDRMEKHPELTPEQTSSYAQKIYAKIKAANDSSKEAKTPKIKKKQGI